MEALALPLLALAILVLICSHLRWMQKQQKNEHRRTRQEPSSRSNKAGSYSRPAPSTRDHTAAPEEAQKIATSGR